MGRLASERVFIFWSMMAISFWMTDKASIRSHLWISTTRSFIALTFHVFVGLALDLYGRNRLLGPVGRLFLARLALLNLDRFLRRNLPEYVV